MEFKKYIILFIVFIFIQNKHFISFISKINGTVNSDGVLTNYGIIIQGIFLVISFILLELLVEYDVL
jgi:hypothetical protein